MSEIKSVFIVRSEWDSESGRDSEINGVYKSKEDALQKFNDIVRNEKTNSLWIDEHYDECEEELNEVDGYWFISLNFSECWFETTIEECVLN